MTVSLEEVLALSSVDSPPVLTSAWQAFKEDVEFAGTTVESLSETLDLPITPQLIPKAAFAYLELLLKLKDSRHGEVP